MPRPIVLVLAALAVLAPACADRGEPRAARLERLEARLDRLDERLARAEERLEARGAAAPGALEGLLGDLPPERRARLRARLGALRGGGGGDEPSDPAATVRRQRLLLEMLRRGYDARREPAPAGDAPADDVAPAPEDGGTE